MQSHPLRRMRFDAYELYLADEPDMHKILLEMLLVQDILSLV